MEIHQKDNGTKIPEQKTEHARIYLADVKPLEDSRLFDMFCAAASEERKTKISRLRFYEDKVRALGVETLLRYALKREGRSMDPLSYAYGTNGKPYLAGADGFFFNASHDGEYVILAVSDTEVGCDVERIEPVRTRLAARVLTPTEYAAYEMSDPEERDTLFFRYWVCKESCMKALGEGLAADPASFEIAFGPPVRVRRNGVPAALALQEGDDIPGYRYAVCRMGQTIEVQTEIVRFKDIAGGRIL